MGHKEVIAWEYCTGWIRGKSQIQVYLRSDADPCEETYLFLSPDTGFKSDAHNHVGNNTGHDLWAVFAAFKRMMLRLPENAQIALLAWMDEHGLPSDRRSIGSSGPVEDFSSAINATAEDELDALFAQAQIYDDDDRMATELGIPPPHLHAPDNEPPLTHSQTTNNIETTTPTATATPTAVPSASASVAARSSVSRPRRRELNTVRAVSLTMGQGNDVDAVAVVTEEVSAVVPQSAAALPGETQSGHACRGAGNGHRAGARGRGDVRGQGEDIGTGEGVAPRRSRRARG